MSPPDSDKKRRSGRDQKSGKKSGTKKSVPAAFSSRAHHEVIEDGRELYSPWLPLIWMLIPLFGCVAYGLWTR